jgi:3-hydroxymyristoyl/3-hydroxydecanoyl-(acyl carrier protein) dehydratase
MQAGGWVETQYDIPEEAWYFKANQTAVLPFCILLEIALQPCGWLAAYAGSALESKDRLHFRNLGGKAVLFTPVSRDSGSLTIRTRITEVSKAGGMIIQEFDFEVLKNKTVVYKGNTNFGFFSPKALSNQIGIRNSRLTDPVSRAENVRPAYDPFQDAAPLTPDDSNQDKNSGMPSKALRMIDQIEILELDTGLYGKGYIRAKKAVDPLEWFFQAHFYQDPVCPGSLGIESFLQMIRFFLLEKFEVDPDEYEPDLLVGQSHEWIYRGQIIPDHKKIQVHAHIKDTVAADKSYTVVADGSLTVDGICIYEMKNFGIVFSKISEPAKRIKIQDISEQN